LQVLERPADPVFADSDSFRRNLISQELGGIDSEGTLVLRNLESSFRLLSENLVQQKQMLV
jgi:hypothetical protein